jgi:hypothetical protein
MAVVGAAARLNLAAIASSLRQVQEQSVRIGERLSARRDPLDDRVIDNILAG